VFNSHLFSAVALLIVTKQLKFSRSYNLKYLSQVDSPYTRRSSFIEIHLNIIQKSFLGVPKDSAEAICQPSLLTAFHLGLLLIVNLSSMLEKRRVTCVNTYKVLRCLNNHWRHPSTVRVYLWTYKTYNFNFSLQIATVKVFVMCSLWLDNLFIEAATN
jgi:hypothetical protein